MTTIKVNLKNAKENFNSVKKLTDKKIICVVKSNGYGHGLKVAKVFQNCGAHAFAVANYEEAFILRKMGIKKDILITNFAETRYINDLVKFNVTLALIDYSYAKHLNDFARKHGVKIKAHIAFDTGMHRFGFPLSQVGVNCAKQVFEMKNLSITGLYTHFSCADEPNDGYTKMQINNFYYVKNHLNFNRLFTHASNSSALINYPYIKEDAVRTGIILYGGINTSLSKSNGACSKLTTTDFKPLFDFKTTICCVKNLSAGDRLGYGGYCLYENKKIAILPIGYNNGFFPKPDEYVLSVNGKKAPIIGRVCMNHCFIDVTNVNVSVGDEVTVLSTSEDLFALSKAQNLSVYQTLCLLGGQNARHLKYIDA